MEINGISWHIMEYQGTSWNIQWNISATSMEHHGIYNGISSKINEIS